MTSKYVIPADTQQWLSGIGARLPRSENHAADQLAASDHHTCEDGEQAAVVDLDDHDAHDSLGGDAALGDDRAAGHLAGDDPNPEPTAHSDPAHTTSEQPRSQPQTQALDAGTAAARTPPDDPDRPSARRFKPWVVGALVAVTAVATLITATMTFVNTPSPPPALTSSAPSTFARLHRRRQRRQLQRPAMKTPTRHCHSPHHRTATMPDPHRRSQ